MALKTAVGYPAPFDWRRSHGAQGERPLAQRATSTSLTFVLRFSKHERGTGPETAIYK